MTRAGLLAILLRLLCVPALCTLVGCSTVDGQTAAPTPPADPMPAQTTPTAQTRSARKPYVPPRLVGRPGTTAAPSNAAPKTSTTIAEIFRSPNAGPVTVSGTVMEVMSTKKILLWDGTAAMAVRLDGLSIIPELVRAQRVTVCGGLLRQGAAPVELQAVEIR